MSQPGVIGTRIDRYQVEQLLGAGGFGSVYRARHVHTDVVVALKVLKRAMSADQQMVERFLREAKAAAAVGSPHIVGVLDAGVSADAQAFLALEYLQGVDLKELALREGPLTTERLLSLMQQVLEGLGAAHARGIVHRDMKPANVFVAQVPDATGRVADYVKLLDFGISKMRDQGEAHGLTMTGVAMGTPSYMSPEQFFDARSVDARADLYSVAVMLYELLTTRLPFDAPSYAELIVKVRTEEPLTLSALAPQVPAPLAQVVMVGLAKDRLKRWQTAADFAAALRSAAPAPARATPLPVGGPLPLNTPAVVSVSPSTPSLPQFTPGLTRTLPTGGAAKAPPVPAGALPATAQPGAPVKVTRWSTTTWVLLLVGVLVVTVSCCLGTAVLSQLSKDAQHRQLERDNEP